MKRLMSRPRWLVYNDAAAGATPAVTPAAGDPGAAAGDTGAAAGANGQTDGEKPTITAAQMNKIVEERLAREKKKSEEEKSKVITQLEQLQRAKGLTEKDKETLQAQIDEMKTSMLTKEQLAAKEKEKLAKEYTEKLTEAEKRAQKNWELYEKSTIKREITDAAVKEDAYRPSQIVKHLIDMTQLVEEKDETGQGLGTFTPRVKFPDVKDGKPVTLDLTAEQAVKRMKEMPDEFGNLFKSGVAGGLGGAGGSSGNSSPGTGLDEPAPKDPDKYAIWRAKQKKAGRL